ncbi:MAG: nitrite reductase large subunit NirB [Granulosicoccaceae bacterium]
MQNKYRVVVIGNGMVGHKFLDSLAKSEAAGEYAVEVFGEESHVAYDRVHLSEYYSGRSADDLSLASLGYYEEQGYKLRTNCRVEAIDRSKKSVSTSDGDSIPYDKLVLATGSFPFVPPIPGADQDGCFVYRTLEDLDSIKERAVTARRGVVVGGGLLGLEAANALKLLGLETHVVEFAPSLMPVQLDKTGGEVLRTRIEDLGVQVHTEKTTSHIKRIEDNQLQMCFADGETLETDLIVFSAGIRPRDQLARDCELAIGERGGIVINDQCQTSDDDIYAIGECALWQNKVFGLVGPGYTMADVCVKHLQGQEPSFQGADMSTKLKLLGVDVGSIGDAHATEEGAQVLTYHNTPTATYARLVVNKGYVSGAVLVGNCEPFDTLLQYMLNQIDLPEQPEQLILPSSDGSSIGLSADALPDTATICSCLNVTKGHIISAIDEGACSVADVKSCTGASSGCGGCAALLGSVVNAELSARGVEVSTDICEHFPHTRQELYHLVQVEKIRSFDALINKYGKGLGCDICKPAVGSILASVWNDYVLDEKHLPLQDTNDTFLANMQKNGTYSVVPRVPAGEITPAGLIAIGEVAKEYDLYTKITGGQRIDLFGARKEDLPVIWRKLIDAGFETGHAYGKSLRTVKSCVGSTWCRYGVQDSVGMAIQLENRYKGLRSPHKIKFAVSGCTRECAEAQSKDIGVIATENGWNLYVCGNGGMKPRHADLFATDLDDEQLVKLIDRVLMFYVRTGDRLQRTSVWMENLEGGLQYLKQVVLEDSLGINAELEAQMHSIVNTYQCEWKTTIENPEKLVRFKPFINSDKPDPSIVFDRERGQIKPAEIV